ncbi:MAG: DNA-3-methyladenine glycosylase, partial [bacterium]|nr:DNA-3-methyladenine glycosylase [bacterium]
YWKGEGDLFIDLIDSIISQQLSGKAAATIFQRFKDLYGKKFPAPKQILDTSDEKLRGVGLSRAKAVYIKALSQAILDGSLNLKQIPSMQDEEIIVELTKIKGIGRWTSEMILMFSLGRPDVFSTGDLGLCKAVYNLYGISPKDKAKIEALSLTWSPHRSLASRYLWKSLEKVDKK